MNLKPSPLAQIPSRVHGRDYTLRLRRDCPIDKFFITSLKNLSLANKSKLQGGLSQRRMYDLPVLTVKVMHFFCDLNASIKTGQVTAKKKPPSGSFHGSMNMK
jgi:hypothetical protein